LPLPSGFIVASGVWSLQTPLSSKTIFEPSGAQSGSASSPESAEVMSVMAVPSLFTVHASAAQPRLTGPDSASFRPFGCQETPSAPAPLNVPGGIDGQRHTTRVGLEPSASIRIIWPGLWFGAQPSLLVMAIFAPSGDHATEVGCTCAL